MGWYGFAVGAAVGAVVLAGSAPASAAPAVSCGDTVTTSVTLRADLRCAGDGLTIGADGVTVNLNGHTLAGDGTGVGVTATGNADLTVRGGRITGFRQGVHLLQTRNTTLAGVDVLHDGGAGAAAVQADEVRGLRLTGGEIVSRPGAYAVRGSLVDDLWMRGVDVTGQVGLDGLDGGSIVDCVIRDGMLLLESGEVVIRRNTVTDGITLSESGPVSVVDNDLTGGGVHVAISDHVLVRRNTVRAANAGVSVAGPSRNLRVLDNTFVGGTYGMLVRTGFLDEVSGMTVAGNTFTGNRAAGMFVEAPGVLPLSAPVQVVRNVFRFNGFHPSGADAAGRPVDDGLHADLPVGSGLVAAGNRTHGNADLGIEALPPGSVVDGGGNVSDGDHHGCAGVVCG